MKFLVLQVVQALMSHVYMNNSNRCKFDKQSGQTTSSHSYFGQASQGKNFQKMNEINNLLRNADAKEIRILIIFFQDQINQWYHQYQTTMKTNFLQNKSLYILYYKNTKINQTQLDLQRYLMPRKDKMMLLLRGRQSETF